MQNSAPRGRAIGRLLAVIALVLGLVPFVSVGAAQAAGTLEIVKSVNTSPYPQDAVPVSNTASAVSPAFGYTLAVNCITAGESCDDVVITDTLPSYLEYATDPVPSNTTVSGQSVSIDLGDAVTSQTVSFLVRFRPQIGAPANSTFPTSNTASVTSSMPDPQTSTSNSVDVTGVVKPIGGVTAAKSFSPTTVTEFSDATVTMTLTGTNTGTTTADTLTLTDVNSDIFDRFDINSLTLPAGASLQISNDEGSTWVPATLPVTTGTDGVRIVIPNVAAGAAVSVPITLQLRQDVASTGGYVTGANSTTYTNHVTAAVDYPGTEIDDTSDPATAPIRIIAEHVNAPTVTKTTSPATALEGSNTPVTQTVTMTNSGSGAGISTMSIVDPSPDPAATAGTLGNAIRVNSLTVTWPQNTPAGSTGSATLYCSGVAQPATAISPGVGAPPTTALTLPAGCNVTGFVVTFTAPAGQPFAFADSARVVIGGVTNASAPAGTTTNTAHGTATSANGKNQGQSATVRRNFRIDAAHYAVNHGKRFVMGPSISRFNQVELPTRYNSNVPADQVVIQDPSPATLIPGVGSAFFDEWDIRAIRATGCLAGDTLTIELYNVNTSTWQTLTTTPANSCAAALPIRLSAAQQASTGGIRFTYDNPDAITDNRNYQPRFDVYYRTTLRSDSSVAQPLPVEPDPAYRSPENCSATAIDTNTVITTGEVTAPCPQATILPLSTGGGISIDKVMYGPGGDTAPAVVEGSQDGLVADVNFTLWEFPVERVTITDPVTSSSGTYDPITETFLATVDLNTLTYVVKPHERARLYLHTEAGGWSATPVATRVATTSAQTLTYTNTDPMVNGWRMVLDENPLSPGSELGSLEPFNYSSTAERVRATFTLRDTFRNDVGPHSAGDPVLNNLCYSVDGTPSTQDPPNNSIEACEIPDGVFTQDSDDWGMMLNMVRAQADFPDDGDPSTNDFHVASDSAMTNNFVYITHGAVAAEITKTFLPNGEGEVAIPLPVSGASPSAAQQRTVRLVGTNTSGGVNVDRLIISDVESAFWDDFDLISVNNPGFADARFDLLFADTTTSGPLTWTAVNALPNLDQVVGITVTFLNVPAFDTAAPTLHQRSVEFTVQLRETSRANGADNLFVGERYNQAGIRAEDGVDTNEPNPVPATISVRGTEARVDTDKTITLAAGEVDSVDLEPRLNVSISSRNFGELDIDSLITEDDDVLDPADYATPSTPNPLPNNASETDFWGQVRLVEITGITAPAGALTGTVEVLLGGTWTTLITGPVADVSPAAVNAALADPASVNGIRVTWNGTIGSVATAVLTYDVTLNSDADTSVSLANCAETGYAAGTTTVYERPDCAPYTPQVGTTQIDVDKVFLPTEADNISSAPGRDHRLALDVANVGQTRVGLRDTQPFTIVDLLGTQWQYDPLSANIVIDLSNAPNSNLSDTVVPVLAGETLSWIWPAGQYLAPGDSIRIQITLATTPGQAPGDAPNWIGVPMPEAAYCSVGTGGDIYLDGQCRERASVNITSGGSIRAIKRSTGTQPNRPADPASTTVCPTTPGERMQSPCVAVTPPDGTYDWHLSVANTGNRNLADPVIIDRLPGVGDDWTLVPTERGTEWRGTPSSPITVSYDLPAGQSEPIATIEYLTDPAQVDTCVAELSNGTVCGGWAPLAASDTLPADALLVRATFQDAAGGDWTMSPLATVRMTWQERAPEWDDLDSSWDQVGAAGQPGADGRFTQWNSFGYRVATDTGDVLRNESQNKAGVQLGTGIIEVTKTVDNAPGPDMPYTGPTVWTFEVASSNCDIGPLVATSLTTPAGTGGTVTFKGLLIEQDRGAGLQTCRYDVTEVSVPGWTMTTGASDITDLTTTLTGITEVSVNNRQDVGDISIVKTVTGAAAPADWEFTLTSVTAGCYLPGAADPYTSLTQTTSGAGGTTTFEDVPVYSTTVPSDPTLSPDPGRCVYSVAENTQTGYRMSVPADSADLGGLLVVAGDTTTVEITNEQTRGRIVIRKFANPGDDGAVFPFLGTVTNQIAPLYIHEGVDGQGAATLASEQLFATTLLPAGDAQAAPYAVREDLPVGWLLDPNRTEPIVCESLNTRDGDPMNDSIVAIDAGGEVSVTTLGVDDVVVCDFYNARDGVVVTEKEAAQATPLGNNQFEVVYTVTVSNYAHFDKTYDLEDALTPGGGISVLSTHVQAPAGVTTMADWDGQDKTALTDDTVIAQGTTTDPTVHTYTVTVVFEVPTTITDTERDCTVESTETGTGFLNSAEALVQGQDTEPALGCTEVPPGNLVITKEVSAGPSLIQGREYEIEYTIVVSNDGDGPIGYELTDEFMFAPGTSVQSVSVRNTVPGTISTNAGFNGAGDQLIATDALAAADAHSYVVTVRADVSAVTEIAYYDCDISDSENTGFRNVAMVNPTAQDCAEIPPPPPELGQTGAAVGASLLVTLAATGIGGLLVWLSRRRRQQAN
ncbi:MAG: hypothetical protein ACK5KU_08660 [Beutenbergiaceae bacterium]